MFFCKKINDQYNLLNFECTYCVACYLFILLDYKGHNKIESLCFGLTLYIGIEFSFLRFTTIINHYHSLY